jgi:hypothetical protein
MPSSTHFAATADAFRQREVEILHALMELLRRCNGNDDVPADPRFDNALQLLIDEELVTSSARGLYRLEWDRLEKRRQAVFGHQVEP